MRPLREPGKLTPPTAHSISSSCIRLEPGASVGEHKTEGKEELLIVLEGEATLLIDDEDTKIPRDHAAYVPPNTRHDVANRGRKTLVYVYVTAKVPARTSK